MRGYGATTPKMRSIPSRSRLALGLALAGMLAALPAAAARVTLHLLQPDGRALAGAVLYALPLDGRRLPPPSAAVMDQRDRRFVPQILPVQTGAAVSFPNTDSISHHVYSFSPAKRFELYLPKRERAGGDRGAANLSGRNHGDPPPAVVFDRPGVVALGCNIHDWMLGYILVVDSAWFTQTDSRGVATLELPGGHYRLVAWHPRITDPEASLGREARLGAEDSETWELALHMPLLPQRDQEPGFKDY